MAVELPGEANPLDLQNVLNSLMLAASSTQQQVQTGSKQLQNWEKEEKYFTFLQDIFLDYSVPVEVRYLAILQLKNGIDKYWRRTATHAIEKEEKDHIKFRAVQAGISEPAPALALHNSLMIAKIMRYEFPQDWPNGITSIISFLRTSTQPGANPLQLQRTLTMLLQVIKELSTARLQRTRTNLQAISPEMFHVLGGIYVDNVNKWTSFLEQGNTDEGVLMEALEQSRVAIKVIRRLVIAGFEHPNRDNDVQEFWVLTYSHFSRFLAFVLGDSAIPEEVHRLIEKHLLQLSKLHVEMARTHPASFALLPDSIPLVQSYWTLVVKLGEEYDKLLADSDSEGKSLIEQTGLRALLLIRACARMAFSPIHTFKYQTAEDKEEKKQAVELIKAQLFTNDFVVNVMELVVTQFFRFRKGDFEEWEEAPEEWERREAEISEAWEFSIRSCSEKLFLDLVIHFKELLIPRLLTVFYSFAGSDKRDVLLKDSLYSAVGLAAASLEQHLDFNAFLESTLVPEVQIQEQGYNVLRRRIAILLGQWVPVKAEEINMNCVYQIFQHLLGKQDPLNDLVVRITAGRQLREVLNPFEFSPVVFMPYAPSILEGLLSLVQEAELAESKMQLLDTVRSTVIKMEDHITPFSDQILALLPPLWDTSGEEYLMKQAVLTLLSALMNSLKQDSAKYHSLILPLIRNATDTESEMLLYCLDEALDLWSAIMMQTPSPATPELLSLVPALYPIFESATDCVPQALQIAESYIILAPQEILSDRIRLPLLTSFEVLLSSSARQQLGTVPRLVELMVRAAQAVDNGSENTYNVIARSLIDSSFLATLLRGLHSAYEASQTTGPHRKTTPIYGVVETDYLSVLARFALASPGIFVSAIAATTGTPVDQSLPWLLTEWFQHYDNIGSVNQKKLHALALSQLLALNSPNPPPPYILAHLQSYLTTWTDIVTELAEGADADPINPHAGDYLILWNRGGAPDQQQTGAYDENEPPENSRKREWESSDIIHNINIRDFVRDRLRALIVACGGEEKFQEEWLVNVDREVVAAFGALGLF